MTKNKTLSRTLLAVLIGAATFGAQAADDAGFYVGAGAGQSFVDEPDIAGPSLEANSAYITAVGTLPFTDSFSGYAKAGYQRWDLDNAIPGLTGTTDDSGNDLTYGVGLQYRFNDTIALRGEYSRFEIEDLDADLAQVQVRFDF
jgi:OmpA-OmpF porin, OOP family